MNALFVGGDYRVLSGRIAGNLVAFAIRGKWKFTDEQWSDAVEKIIAFERTFWRDDNSTFFLVVLTPLDKEKDNWGGTALTNAFMMHVSPEKSLGPDLLSTVAHETFHEWNPYRIGYIPGSDYPVSWFFEGFTTFYERRILLLAGIINFEQFVSAVNNLIYRYDTQPGTTVTLEEFIRRHTAEPSDLDQLDKRRGAVLAVWLDAVIRNRTNNAGSLDALMFALFDQNNSHKKRNHGAPLALTNNRIFRQVSKLAGASAARQFRTYVRNGGMIPLPENALGSCVRLTSEEVPSFDPGFGLESLKSADHIAERVEAHGPAYRAGLRNGQKLVGWSIFNGDTSKPVKLTIKDANGTRLVEYRPIGTKVVVQQFEINQELYNGEPDGCAVAATH